MPDIASMSRMAIAAPLYLVILSACVAEGPPSPGAGGIAPGGLCDRARAQALIGGPPVADGRALELTGATRVRQIEPGDPTTRDGRPDRVTITTDRTAGIVTEAGCF